MPICQMRVPKTVTCSRIVLYQGKKSKKLEGSAVSGISWRSADLRGKELVMRLMMHPDPTVQKQALLSVQKVMLARDKLEFLNAQEA